MRMRRCFFIAFLFGFLLLYVNAHAQTYIDHMGEASSDEIKTYYNLKQVNVDNNPSWGNLLPDKSFLSFSSISQPVGKAVYEVRSASTFTVGIYTDVGTFASLIQADNAYALGFNELIRDHSRRPSGSIQALYSPSRQTVYLNWGSGAKSLVFNNYYEFKNLAENEPSDLINYGVNVYASYDGVSFSRLAISAEKSQYIPKANYCYEEFSGNLPAKTVKVMVEINDFNQFFDVSGNKYCPKLAIRMASLAYVSFSGEALEVGPEAPELLESSLPELPTVIPETVPSSQSSKTSTSSQSRKNTGINTDDLQSSKNASSAKFEGIITSSKSSSSTRSQSTPASSKKTQVSESSDVSVKSAAESSASKKTSGENSAAGISAPDVVIYKTPSQHDPDNMFKMGIVGYIGVVCFFILFILLRSKGK